LFDDCLAQQRVIHPHQQFMHIGRRIALLHQVDEKAPCRGHLSIAPVHSVLGGMASDLDSVCATCNFVSGSFVVSPIHCSSFRKSTMCAKHAAMVSLLARRSSILGLPILALQLCDGGRLGVRHAPVRIEVRKPLFLAFQYLDGFPRHREEVSDLG